MFLHKFHRLFPFTKRAIRLNDREELNGHSPNNKLVIYYVMMSLWINESMLWKGHLKWCYWHILIEPMPNDGSSHSAEHHKCYHRICKIYHLNLLHCFCIHDKHFLVLYTFIINFRDLYENLTDCFLRDRKNMEAAGRLGC